MRKKTIFICVFGFICLFGLLTIEQFNSTSCSCFDMTQIKKQCFNTSEYSSHTPTTGTCNLQYCEAEVTVICLDFDNGKEQYKQSFFMKNMKPCADCAGNTTPTLYDPNKRDTDSNGGYHEFDFME